jgi:hypothetical protein
LLITDYGNLRKALDRQTSNKCWFGALKSHSTIFIWYNFISATVIVYIFSFFWFFFSLNTNKYHKCDKFFRTCLNFFLFFFLFIFHFHTQNIVIYSNMLRYICALLLDFPTENISLFWKFSSTPHTVLYLYNSIALLYSNKEGSRFAMDLFLFFSS